MKQLSICVAKNATISDLVCTPNTIVLAKQTTSTNATTSEITTTVRYIEVCQVEKTDPLTIVQNLLKFCVAEFFVCNELEKDFSDTNIKQRKLFNQFLSGDTIYRTNSEGKISNAVVSEVPLNRTALRVQKTHTVVLCKPENRKAAIYQHAKAILAQSKYLRLIIDKAEAIGKDAEKAETPIATAKTARRSTVATGTTPPAMVAAPAQ